MSDIVSRYNICTNDSNNSRKKLVVIVHGFGEHLKKYDELDKILSKNGYVVLRYDLRGHGRSNCGDMGDVNSYFDMVDDLDAIITYAKEKYDAYDIYTLGHSMGGLISLLYGVVYGVKEDIKGQILSAPESDVPIRGFSVNLLNYLSYIVPLVRMNNPMYNPENIYYDNYYLKKMTLRFSREMFIKAPKYLKSNLNKYMLPCMFLHGDADKWINYECSRYTVDTIPSKNKQLKKLSGIGHGILLSEKKLEAIELIIDWLNNN